MRRRFIYPKEVTDQEARRLAEPAALATVVLCILLIISEVDVFISGKGNYLPIILGIAGIFYALTLFYGIMPSPKLLQIYKWPIIITNAASVSIGMSLLSAGLQLIPQIIMLLISAIVLILWDRIAAYAFIILAGGSHFLLSYNFSSMPDFINHTSFFLVSVIVVETIQRLTAVNLKRIGRLQTINEFARKVSASLDADEVQGLIGDALMNAIQADSYYFGIVNTEMINMQLLYDEGEFFPAVSVPIDGSLSGWVIRNQQSLFIADLRNDVDLEGVKMVLMGKDKTSLCWMGVPLNTGYAKGIIAVASYTQNDFNRTDLELLENLAQQAGLVLENAYHHAEVKAQSHLDSLTNVYNHGYTVQTLNSQAKSCLESGTKLSLIMLDIDYFKQYNDNYGHMVGDQVLIALTQAIRQHIKADDAVGRWGGEEFTVVLPCAGGQQARQVAERIQQTVISLSIQDRDGKLLPFPTVSQGFAVFPDEADSVDALIDLADQRLYVAKERGRNQIEPKLKINNIIK
jgi:diguanylate cyclase (GGDEF)-like protein